MSRQTWYSVEPMQDQSWIGQRGRTPTQFSAKLTDTLTLLRSEIDAITARGTLGDPVLQLDLDRADLRLDGGIRAKAQTRTGAVAVSFESAHGPLMFRCDRYYTNYYSQGESWHHNLRAIALTLQSLRAVARYGATASGEQYTGFRQIEAARPMTQPEALQALWTAAGFPGRFTSDYPPAELYRRARRSTHPDRPSGTRAAWDAVERAGHALGLA
ncbi:hypothetical protein FB459_2032 [Yimella lutea]|uniref:Molecular chaperone DnaJ n=1 Tax=Yimella lutea TaxID=587872 RepID=A0A542EGX5_9MICO|nr:molecular chaperone DnaJ [Yimella lutea]TQJ14565.1 hypothetical protein FB459_2032 [Yimella lutea]